MPVLSPTLDDIRFSYAIFMDMRVAALPPVQFKALMNLIRAVAAGLVWTYSPPSDGSLPGDEKSLAHLAFVSNRQWQKIRSDIQQFFSVIEGRWHLNEAWIEIGGPSRTNIPLVIQQEILAREGSVCTYCGDTSGPFEFDHIFPVIRGGKNDPSNLTLACTPCNRSKKARTLREWMA